MLLADTYNYWLIVVFKIAKYNTVLQTAKSLSTRRMQRIVETSKYVMNSGMPRPVFHLIIIR